MAPAGGGGWFEAAEDGGKALGGTIKEEGVVDRVVGAMLVEVLSESREEPLRGSIGPLIG